MNYIMIYHFKKKKWILKFIEYLKKLLCSFCDKKEYVVHIRTLKETLNRRLTLQNVDAVVKFNQKV